MKNIRIFILKLLVFVVKFSIYLNRRVFIMEGEMSYKVRKDNTNTTNETEIHKKKKKKNGSRESTLEWSVGKLLGV